MTMVLSALKKTFLIITPLAVASGLASCSSSTTGSSGPSGSGNSTNISVGGNKSHTGGSSSNFVLTGGAQNNGGATGTGNKVDAGPYCGDGKVQPEINETCDDGNRLGGDGCSGICKIEPNWECPKAGEPCKSLIVCGNGKRQIGEGCDDGNTKDGDGCDKHCNSEAGWYCAPENADDVSSKSACQKLASCGDGRITVGESCDLGDTNGKGEGCDENCGVQDGWVCRPLPTGCKHMSVCGNSKLEDGEQCDDGNTEADDGCSPSCQIEASFYNCDEVGSLCTDVSRCGNGILEKSEECDDNNNDDNDGCASDCKVEDGFQCRMAGQPCVPLCGDGKLVGAETCDDGNKTNGDGCSITCLAEPGFTCTGTGAGSCVESKCGDGKKDSNEACDEGEKNGLFYGIAGKGCSKTCTKEPDCRPDGKTGACSNVCGDGNKSPTEDCDDGNTFSGDGCSDECKKEDGFNCKDEGQTDEIDCPSDPSQKCLVLPVTYRDFEGQQVSGGHPDFFYLGAAVTNGRTVGVTTGASKTTCVPNASGTKLTFDTSDPICLNSDQTGPCQGLVKDALDGEGKPVMNKDTCPCAFTDWDRTGVLGTCPASGTSQCTPASGISGVQDCYVEGEGSHRLRIEGNVKMFQSADSFKQWYRESDQSKVVYGQLELAKSGNYYKFSSSKPGAVAGADGSTRADDIHEICLATNHKGKLESGFFPIEDAGGTKICNIWPYWIFKSSDSCCAGKGCPVLSQWDPNAEYDNCPEEGTGGPVPKSDGSGGMITGVERNFYMTTEVRYLFRFDAKNPPTLSFYGDDDVWVFVNGKLALDLGGTHERLEGTVKITAATYGLTDGNTYEIAVFHADRNPVDSNYQLTLSGFTTVRTVCAAACGDGKVTGGEECDLGPGKNTGEYGGCNDDCTYASFCGDGEKNGDEECDDGKNTTVTSAGTDANACGPGCKLPPRCGDGATQTGEECDDGDGNTDQQCGGCNQACHMNPYCGDGNTDGDCGEQCDDGVNIGGYGYCKSDCSPDSFCGDGHVDGDFGETCDDGDKNSDDPGASCNTRCGQPEICGDAVKQGKEACDLGVAENTGAYGGCTPDCQLAAFCGDGVKNGTEDCDYGDKNHGGGNASVDNAPYGSCLETCKLGPRCGDSVVQKPEEQCDEGADNGKAGIPCSAVCAVGDAS